MAGWIKLDRDWFKQTEFTDEPYTEREAWLWIMSSAAYEPHTRYVSGHAFKVDRGQVMASLRTLANEWRWGVQRVRGFISKLTELEKITVETDRGVTVISLRETAISQKQQHASNTASNTGCNTDFVYKNCEKSDIATQAATQLATREQHIKEEGIEILPIPNGIGRTLSGDVTGDQIEQTDDNPERAFWQSAKGWLEAHGKSKSQAGSLIGKWLKDHGKPMTQAAINAAQLERAVDPVAYVAGYVRRQGQAPPRSFAETVIERNRQRTG